MRFKKIYLEITNYCNKNCSFCSKDNREQKEMSLEEIKSILPDIKKYTDYVYLHVKGEPLLHSEFKEIINYLDSENMWINITTNGTLIDKHIKEISNNKHLRQINISVHSFNDDKYIDRILASIDEILANNSLINIVLRFWALEDNTFSKANLLNINKIISHYELDNSLIEEIYKKNNIKLKDRLYLNKDSLFEWPSLDNKIYEDSFCYGLKTQIAILSNGTVVPCCLDSSGIINLGNIFETSLEEILNSEKTKLIINGFRNNKAVHPLCQHCSFRLR